MNPRIWKILPFHLMMVQSNCRLKCKPSFILISFRVTTTTGKPKLCFPTSINFGIKPVTKHWFSLPILIENKGDATGHFTVENTYCDFIKTLPNSGCVNPNDSISLLVSFI